MVSDSNIWSEKEVEDLMEHLEKEDFETGGDDDPPSVHPGTVMVGIVLTILIIHSVYVGEYQFASLNAVLLVILALGSKAIN